MFIKIQINRPKPLEKAELLEADMQGKALTDMVASNQAGGGRRASSGGWQGVSIPDKGMALNLRRAIDKGEAGRALLCRPVQMA